MRFLLRVALLTAAFIIGTWVLGWWAIPLFAAVAGVLARHAARQAAAAGIAAVLAWGSLLAWSGLGGSIWSFAAQVGGAMGVPGSLLVIVTLVFPALLAWLAASLAQLVARGNPATN